jgi:hypothetical protein
MTKPSIVYVALFVFVLAMAQGANGQTPQPDPKSPQYRATGEQDRSYTFPGRAKAFRTTSTCRRRGTPARSCRWWS